MVPFLSVLSSTSLDSVSDDIFGDMRSSVSLINVISSSERSVEKSVTSFSITTFLRSL